MTHEVKLLQDLVAIRSYSGEEREIRNFISTHFKNSGLETLEQGNNLIFHIAGKDNTRAFIFNSHMDIVDIGEESKWKHNPWGTDIEGDRIYGRGTSDMKSGLSASIQTAISLAGKDNVPCDVWFTYVVKEEVDGSGTKDFADWFQKEGYMKKYEEVAALFTEPTSLALIEHGHRGNYFLKAEIQGDAGHASRPQEIKINTIMRMVSFISHFEEKTALWKNKFQDSLFTPPTLTCTSINAHSKSPNRVSDYCQAILDLRTIPTFHEDAYEEVRKLAEKYGITLSLLFPDSPTGYTKPDAKIVKSVQKAVPSAKLSVSSAAADLGFLTAIGIEGVIFGPGDINQAHANDEYVSIDQVLASSKIFEEIYYNWADSLRK